LNSGVSVARHRRVHVSRGRVVAVRLVNKNAFRVGTRLVLRSARHIGAGGRQLVFGRASVSIGARGVRYLKLRVSRSDAAALARHRHVFSYLTVLATNGSGQRRADEYTFTLLPAGGRR
jgi:hypothetical protein